MKTTFKIIAGNLYEYNSNGKITHSKNSDGYECWSEYDSDGKEIHYKHSSGFEIWREYDSNGNKTHSKTSNGFESWHEYDSNGNLIHSGDSDGYETWYDSNGKEITKKEFDKLNSSCDGKVVEIDGRKYQLKLV